MLRLWFDGYVLSDVMNALQPTLNGPNPVLIFSSSGFRLYGTDREKLTIVNAIINARKDIKSSDPDSGYNDREITMRLNMNRLAAICRANCGFLICIEVNQGENIISIKPHAGVPPATLKYLEHPDSDICRPQVKKLHYHATVKLPSDMFTRIIGEICCTYGHRKITRFVDPRLGALSVPDPEPSSLADDEFRISVTNEGIKFSIQGYFVFVKRDEAVSFKIKQPVSLTLKADLVERLIYASIKSDSVTMRLYPEYPLRFRFRINNGQMYIYTGKGHIVGTREFTLGHQKMIMQAIRYDGDRIKNPEAEKDVVRFDVAVIPDSAIENSRGWLRSKPTFRKKEDTRPERKRKKKRSSFHISFGRLRRFRYRRNGRSDSRPEMDVSE
ncbi:unnamed protein product [Cuscuta epithymum]|uniref:Proliferating cell nuclear antigen PCNA C-terminal domain-containing protein n=1 Tax=Cuscuta epithymum TaxID=186058 RepID=A0AAV0GK99_9ASTE|nr:unnamed protein product [Cuscuta epithymum]